MTQIVEISHLRNLRHLWISFKPLCSVEYLSE
jgi:hypothetical protein